MTFNSANCHSMRVALFTQINPSWLHTLCTSVNFGKRSVRNHHVRIKTVLSEGSNFDNIFCWWGEEGSKYHFKPAIIGLSAKRHLNDGPTLNSGMLALWFLRGSRPVLKRNPIFFVNFKGGPDPLPPPPPSGSTHEHLGIIITQNMDCGQHISENLSKATKLLGFLLMNLTVVLMSTTNEDSYKAFVRPKLEYALCSTLLEPIV